MQRHLAAAGKMISDRLTVPASVEAISYAAAEANNSIRIWDGVTLANGHAGLATLFATLAAEPHWQGANYQAAAVEHMAAAMQATTNDPITGNDLYSGSSGLAFALNLCAEVEPRFSRARDAARLAALKHGMEEYSVQRADGVAPEDYDVISGPSGYLGWLLNLPMDLSADAIDIVTDTMLKIFEEGPGDSLLPKWRILPELTLEEERLKIAPDGYTDMGLAHGIPGSMAALSLLPAPSQRIKETVWQLAQWIISQRSSDMFGLNWPSIVPVGEVPKGNQSWKHSRTAWCYGSPGVLSALSLAQNRFPEFELGDLIAEGTHALASRVITTQQFSTPTLCHGSAGVAVVLRYLQFEQKEALLEEALQSACEHLLSHVDEDAPFGVREVEPGNQRVDNPTLLNGAAGVALGIHAVLSSKRQPWTRMMMIG
ncbi:lanthionine synthetase LanC family protein [Arthrobacter sp. LS16]|uniref:lanthionine synthetase LanC family protein n=1 Tax=Arthrobacter sp. 'calajunan' TaxID=1690248 RepID=UPI003C78A53F